MPDEEIRYIIDKAIERSEQELPFEQSYEKHTHKLPSPRAIDVNQDPWDRIRKLTRGL